MSPTDQMMSDADRDPALDALLRDPGGPMADADALFAALEQQVEASEKKPAGWLKSRSTPTRRLIAFGAFALVAAYAVMSARDDLGSYPIEQLVVSIGALLVLLGMSLVLAIRPLHEPALPTWKLGSLAGAAVLATVALAFLPGLGETTPAGASLFAMASPCMYMGLALGLPVYAIARIVDRGTRLAGVLAASAAGLTGNLFLQMHCPIDDPGHGLVGHASVVAIFVGGAFLIRLVERRLRS